MPVEVVITETGLEEVDKYVLRCQNTISQYITIRKTMELCLEI